MLFINCSKRGQTAPLCENAPTLRLPKSVFRAQNGKHSDLVVRRYGNGCCCGFAPRFPYPR
ncbi:MAG: hypothetical protein J6R45_01625, partial [Clostridia bacterium]|nr:hypothetical protein [Clostridia bacterium]